TVTTATPVVDVQNTRQVTVLTREVLDVLPRTRVQMYTAALLPGVIITTPGAYQSRRRWKHRQELDVGNRTWRVGRRSNHAGRRNACLRRRGRFPEEFECDRYQRAGVYERDERAFCGGRPRGAPAESRSQRGWQQVRRNSVWRLHGPWA